MSTKCLSWAIDQTTGSPTRKIVLVLLADLADEQATCYPGREYLAERAELSPGAVSKAITGLAADGFVRVLRRARRAGGRTSNRYLLLINGEQTKLPDVDDWVSEFTPTEGETAGQGNDAPGAHMPGADGETAGQSNSAPGTHMPAEGNSAPATHSNVHQDDSSKKEEIYPLGTTQNHNPPPPPIPHPRQESDSAAAETTTDIDRARTVLRLVTSNVDAVRLPTDTECGRLVERVVDLLGAGWSADALTARLRGMGPLDTVASVYAVLSSRLRNVGDPPPAPPGSPPAEQHVPAATWCRSPRCDRTTRRLLDDDDRPLFTLVDGQRRPSWCPDCSGR